MEILHILKRNKVSKREVMSTKLESLSNIFANIYSKLKQITTLETDLVALNQKFEEFNRLLLYIVPHNISTFFTLLYSTLFILFP